MAKKVFRVTEYLTGGATKGVRQYVHTDGHLTLEELLLFTAEARGMEIDDEGRDEIRNVAKMVADAIELIPDAIKETGKEVRLHERVRFFPTIEAGKGSCLSVQLMNAAFIHSLDDLKVSTVNGRKKARATGRAAEDTRTATTKAAAMHCPLTGRPCTLAAEQAGRPEA